MHFVSTFLQGLLSEMSRHSVTIDVTLGAMSHVAIQHLNPDWQQDHLVPDVGLVTASYLISLNDLSTIPLLKMDIIHQCLSLAPVPGLASAFSILRFICSSVVQAQASKGQLQALTQTIAHLLCTLNKEYGVGQLLHAKTSMAVDDLETFVALLGFRIAYLSVSFTQIT